MVRSVLATLAGEFGEKAQLLKLIRTRLI